jgi:hypothetical protein
MRDRPAPTSIPHTVRRPVPASIPHAIAQNVRNVGAVKHGRKAASRPASEEGRVKSGSIGVYSFELG